MTGVAAALVAPTFDVEDVAWVDLHAGVAPGAPSVVAGAGGVAVEGGGLEFGMAWMQSTGLLSTTLVRGPEWSMGRHAVGAVYVGAIGAWTQQPNGPGPGGYRLEGWSLTAGYSVRWQRAGWTVHAALPGFAFTLVEGDWGWFNTDLLLLASELAVHRQVGPVGLVVGAASGIPTVAVQVGDGPWTAEIRETGWPERGFTVTGGLRYQRAADLDWMVPP